MSMIYHDFDRLFKGDIFENIQLYEEIDKDLMIMTIYDYCCDFEMYYFDYLLMKDKTERFFLRYYETFKRISIAITKDYEALENFDRMETNLTDINGNVKNVADTTGEHDSQVAPFDSELYKNQNKMIDTVKDVTQNDSVQHVSENKRMHGNIGVTTSQQMLESEIKLRMEQNLYDLIALKFFDTFMIQIQ